MRILPTGEYVLKINNWDYVPIHRPSVVIKDELIREDYQLVEYGEDCILVGRSVATVIRYGQVVNGLLVQGRITYGKEGY